MVISFLLFLDWLGKLLLDPWLSLWPGQECNLVWAVLQFALLGSFSAL